MTDQTHVLARVLTIVVFSLCAVAAGAEEWTLDVTRSSAVTTDTLHRDLITVSVKKDGNAAPDGTKVILERVEGDAMLVKSDTVLADRLELTTKNGTATASVQMRSEPRALFLATVVPDPNDATKNRRRSLTLNALDDLPEGPILKCFQDDDNDGRSDDPTIDCREDDTFFTFYSGYAVNTFAAEPLRGGRATTATASDIIAGLDFGHALFRRTATGRRRGELWIYGETLHGVVSTNNCDASTTTNGTCDDPDDTTNNLTGVIEDATTLEAYAGLRYEFEIPTLDETASRLYVKGQAGFISILGNGVDLIDNHHAGLGIVKVHGRFTDSYAEFGYGRNDLFRNRNKGRWKVDALVTMNMKWPHTPLIRPFIQLTADTDFGGGEDSVQTFFGLDFDLTLLNVFSVPGRGVGRRR